FISAFDAEGEDGSRAFWTNLFLDFVARAALKPSVADPGNFGMGIEPLRNGQGVVRLALHAERQCLDAGQQEKGVERRDRGAEVAQSEDARGDRKGHRAESFRQLHAVVGGVWIDERFIAMAASLPVVGSAIDDGTADRVAVATDELREAMDDDIGAKIF